MEFAAGLGGNSGAERHQPPRGRVYHRHNAHQTRTLEAFFKDNPHPNESQRLRLGEDLGLDPKQVKFWFQNRRTAMKVQMERAETEALKEEKRRIEMENQSLKDALRRYVYPECGGPPGGQDEYQRNLQKLMLETTQLRQENEKLIELLTQYTGKPIDALFPPVPVTGPTSAIPINVQSSNAAGVPDSDINSTPIQYRTITDVEKSLMTQIALSAMDELLNLFGKNELLSVPSNVDGRNAIHRENYTQTFTRSGHFKSASARVESSKVSGIVTMNSTRLIDMFMDPEKWGDMFSSIVSKARTIHVVDPGTVENKNGCLLLMYEQLHILSPLVPQREYCFLRFCQQIEQGDWIVMNVSYDWPNEDISASRSWRFPSGCLISDSLNGYSKVTWIERVEVDDKNKTHRLYKDLVSGGAAYGAERWMLTLQRMSKRFALFIADDFPIFDYGGVISLPQGRRSIMTLSQRMVNYFHGILIMPDKLDFPHLSEVNMAGVRVSVRQNFEVGQPIGTIVNATTSLWLHLQPREVFNYLKDENKRAEWDVLSYENPMNRVAQISSGSDPGNCISILKPFVPTENSIVILQESCIDSLGGVVVYTPLDLTSLKLVASGEDPSVISILPSGFVISSDGRPDHHKASSSSTSSDTSNSGGSLLTVAFQILVMNDSEGTKEKYMDAVASVNTLVSSAVQKIKASLKNLN